MSVPNVRYMNLQIMFNPWDSVHYFDDYLKRLEDSLKQLSQKCVPLGKTAKQKRIAQLLLILAIVRIKRHLEKLFLLAASVLIQPTVLVNIPTRAARITPFIYFP